MTKQTNKRLEMRKIVKQTIVEKSDTLKSALHSSESTLR